MYIECRKIGKATHRIHTGPGAGYTRDASTHSASLAPLIWVISSPLHSTILSRDAAIGRRRAAPATPMMAARGGAGQESFVPSKARPARLSLRPPMLHDFHASATPAE